MTSSEARVLANRQNALLSTGPKTAEGKDRSRANALKHGLCSTVLVPEDLKVVRQRANDWYRSLKPQNGHQSWLVDEVAVISLRIDRCERIERRLRDRAELAWDDDRMIEVEAVAARLGRRPSEACRQLRATSQGCDWLMSRWAILAGAAERDGTWTADQARLAFDLLGTPPEAREGRQPGDLVDLDGRVVEPAGGPAEVARREMATLEERRARVADLDEVDRALVSADLFDETNAELKRLRRYEAALHTRLRWMIAQLHDPSPHVTRPNPDLKPNWVERVEPDPEAKPEPPPRKEIHPPFCLTPDEFPAPGEEADIPKIIAGRREKKLRAAESRREARRHKAERLRAG